MYYGTASNKVTDQTWCSFWTLMYISLYFHVTYDILLKMPGDVSKKRCMSGKAFAFLVEKTQQGL